MKQKQTHRYRQHTCGCQAGERVGEGRERKSGISRSKPLYIGQKNNNKVILCSTGNYVQYFMTNHNGKDCEKTIYI